MPSLLNKGRTMKAHRLGKDHHVREVLCINCGKSCNGASAIDSDDPPTPGDATVCIYCGHLMVFDEQLDVRNPTDAEIVELAGDERVVLISKALRETKGHA